MARFFAALLLLTDVGATGNDQGWMYKNQQAMQYFVTMKFESPNLRSTVSMAHTIKLNYVRS